jgi:hypothetical protein
MLRFILQHNWRDDISGCEGHDFRTIDALVPELEDTLRTGGMGETGYDQFVLLGVEILPEKDNP